LALREAGVEQIELGRVCTACRTDDFFSHRAAQGKTGRFGALIGLR
jgi:copper oxidase (laccase) domain-containing protein